MAAVRLKLLQSIFLYLFCNYMCSVIEVTHGEELTENYRLCSSPLEIYYYTKKV